MKLVTFSLPGGAACAGALDGDTVASLSDAGLAASVMEIVQGGAAALARVRDGLPRAPRPVRHVRRPLVGRPALRARSHLFSLVGGVSRHN